MSWRIESGKFLTSERRRNVSRCKGHPLHRSDTRHRRSLFLDAPRRPTHTDTNTLAMDGDLDELLLQTLQLLEWRLQRLEFVLHGNTEQAGTDGEATVTSRIEKLERSLQRLSSESRVVSDVLQLCMSRCHSRSVPATDRAMRRCSPSRPLQTLPSPRSTCRTGARRSDGHSHDGSAFVSSNGIPADVSQRLACPTNGNVHITSCVAAPLDGTGRKAL